MSEVVHVSTEGGGGEVGRGGGEGGGGGGGGGVMAQPIIIKGHKNAGKIDPNIYKE